MRFLTLMSGLSIGLVVLGACGGPQSSSTSAATARPATSQPVAATAAPPARTPVTVTGSGISKSKPFHLEGNYAVDWTATPASSGGCFHGASLERADGTSLFESLANAILKDAEPKTGSTNLYNLDAADYYVNASSGCEWSFTFKPQ
jgi:hypothetical protein